MSNTHNHYGFAPIELPSNSDAGYRRQKATEVALELRRVKCLAGAGRSIQSELAALTHLPRRDHNRCLRQLTYVTITANVKASR